MALCFVPKSKNTSTFQCWSILVMHTMITCTFCLRSPLFKLLRWSLLIKVIVPGLVTGVIEIQKKGYGSAWSIAFLFCPEWHWYQAISLLPIRDCSWLLNGLLVYQPWKRKRDYKQFICNGGDWSHSWKLAKINKKVCKEIGSSLIKICNKIFMGYIWTCLISMSGWKRRFT